MRPIQLAMLIGLVVTFTSSVMAQTPAPAAPAATGGEASWWWIILVIVIVVAALAYFMRGRRPRV